MAEENYEEAKEEYEKKINRMQRINDEIMRAAEHRRQIVADKLELLENFERYDSEYQIRMLPTFINNFNEIHKREARLLPIFRRGINITKRFFGELDERTHRDWLQKRLPIFDNRRKYDYFAYNIFYG